MKKILFSLSLLISTILPLVAYATVFEHDLYKGMLGNSDVKNLQEFLHDQGLYNGPFNGNFFSQTMQALMLFQKKEGIEPSQGYFGSKTRSRVNKGKRVAPLSDEEQMALLRSQLQDRLQTLQTQLANLIAQQQTAVATTTPTLSPSPSPLQVPTPVATTTPPTATTTPPAPVAELRISGNNTQLFPMVAVSPLKLGDIIISNTTNRDILFNQIELDIYDGMNSTPNRGKTVIFKLRNGTTTFDSLISQTKFTINGEPPRLGEETRQQVKTSFPRSVQSGQTYTSSLWIENLDYVINGSLRVQTYDVSISDGPAPKGSFTFTLTR